MFIRLLIIFILVPTIEIYVLIKTGQLIGIAPTIGLVFLTGIAGAILARSQGFQLIRRIQNDLKAGRIPANEMMDGAIILAGGLLLLTPGLCTDLFGFCLLTPVTRNIFKGWLKKWLQRKIARGEFRIQRF